MLQLLNKIKILTLIDLENKSGLELFASVAEEYGELARELKIEEKTFGNTYKIPDEGTKGESVDLFICAICMAFAQTSPISFEEATKWLDFEAPPLPEDRKTNAFHILKNMSKVLACANVSNSLTLAQMAIDMFFNRGGTIEEFEAIGNKKLDKWARTQNGTQRMEVAS